MWTLTRTGTVKTTLSAPNQCRHEGWQEYEYEINIKTNHLDKNEWVIEHSEIHTIVEDIFNNKIGTCEKMSKAICDKIHSKGIFFKVRVVLKPNIKNPPAWMEYER